MLGLVGRRLLAGVAFLVLVGSAAATLAPDARAAARCRFSLGAAALGDPAATTVTLTVSAAGLGCRPPSRLRSVRIKIYRGGRLRDQRVLRAIPAPRGRATVTLKGLVRHERLRLTVVVAKRSLAARALVRFRPDLL